MRALDARVPDVVPVSRLANYLMRKIAADAKLRRLGVSGEISGLSIQPNGTAYFDLKDRDALIKCVGWSEAAASFPPLANGQAIVAIGTVGVYPRKTTLQLTVYAIELAGIGRLHTLYEELKRRLGAEGLFDESRKRTLPAFPFRVALVSSRAANGAGDFFKQAADLAPHVTIELFETPVQGENAAPEIVRAIDRASRADVDLVVVARGGGSYEDLFVFNDERIVRALSRCAHPTVSAIGHVVDTPLTDFVADRSAATPSTAAQMFLPRRAALRESLAAMRQRLDRSTGRHLEALRRELLRIEVRSVLAAPERLVAARRQAVDLTAIDLNGAIAAQLRARTESVAALKVRLEACNPNVRLGVRRERLAAATRAIDHAALALLRRKIAAFATLRCRFDDVNPSRRLSDYRERLALARFALHRGAREAAARQRRRLATASARLGPAAGTALAQRTVKLQLLGVMLDGRDPLKILQRGYAIVTRDGAIVRDAGELEPGTAITAQLARGTLTARVESAGIHGGE
jgi:exodeoxyribonuclease VII large subunit